jgi:high-affinity iron transporter
MPVQDENAMQKVLKTVVLLTFIFAVSSLNARADALPPVQVAEMIRSSLFAAQMDLFSDNSKAETRLSQAEAAYTGPFQAIIAAANPQADERIRAGFDSMRAALRGGSTGEFSAARGRTWTAVLNGGYSAVERAIQNGDMPTAQAWLGVREFRTATRFSRPNADATLALQKLASGAIGAEDAIQYLRADQLDTYQARLNEALRDLEAARQNGFSTRQAELAGLAAGYFEILAPAYAEQRGPQALQAARGGFMELETAAISGMDLRAALDSVSTALENYRAAPLSPSEKSRRAGQLLRYLNLVPVEYERGVSNGQVTKQFEIQEAVTFHEAAQAAFDDLGNLLNASHPEETAEAARMMDLLGKQVGQASTGAAITEPGKVRETTAQLVSLLEASMPTEWQKGSTAGDFDVIDAMLDQMLTVVRAGEYDQAESARIEAYAILESGPEARLSVLAPQSKVLIEDLFWNGQGEHKGLAFLIQREAPLSEVKASRAALDSELNAAEEVLSVQSAPIGIVGNASIIVFREGLEAVLILASLMGSMKTAESRKYRRPMWAGTGLALLATVLTWVLARGILVALARYGEKLEAVVSLIAIAVLLLITNWFFHKTYWTSWIASFQSKKKRLLAGEASLILGLISLGFTSVYREGFETVLFLQALVLDSGTGLVLAGVGIGLLATVLIGIVTFKVQARLPYKKMLIITGILIGGVLIVMVGKTVHVLQVVGWLTIHAIPGVPLPFWLGTWFGVYATWDGLGLQALAGAFVIGSYYLAERIKKVQHPRDRHAAIQPGRHRDRLQLRVLIRRTRRPDQQHPD